MRRPRVDRLILSIVVLGSLLSAAACGRMHIGGDSDAAPKQLGALETGVQQLVQAPNAPDYVTRDTEGTRLWKLTRTFYERRNFAPAWIDDGAPRPQMDALINAIRAADREGIDPELYSASLLDRRKEEASKGFLT